MAYQVFTWSPDFGASEDSKPEVTTVKFQDYEQRIERGIHPDAPTWSLKFSGNLEKIRPIRAFLRARGAAESFQWSNPFEEVGAYVCRSWSVSKITGEIATISAKFEKVFEQGVFVVVTPDTPSTPTYGANQLYDLSGSPLQDSLGQYLEHI